MYKCPNCRRLTTADPQLHEGLWRRCDRCGREGCLSCLPINPAPTVGYWYDERYEWICGGCLEDIEERHNRRREAEFGVSEPRLPKPPF